MHEEVEYENKKKGPLDLSSKVSNLNITQQEKRPFLNLVESQSVQELLRTGTREKNCYYREKKAVTSSPVDDRLQLCTKNTESLQLPLCFISLLVDTAVNQPSISSRSRYRSRNLTFGFGKIKVDLFNRETDIKRSDLFTKNEKMFDEKECRVCNSLKREKERE